MVLDSVGNDGMSSRYTDPLCQPVILDPVYVILDPMYRGFYDVLRVLEPVWCVSGR